MPFRPARALLSISAVSITAWAVAASTLTIPSIDAVVNAEVTVIRSLVEGILEGGPPSVGTIVHADEKIGTVKAVLIDRSFIGELQTELRSQEARQDSLNGEIDALRALRADLIERVRNYKKSMFGALGHQIQQSIGEQAAISAEHQQSVRELSRIERLFKARVVSERKFDEAKFAVENLRGRVQSKSAGVEFLRARRDALAAGSFLGDGHNDVPYSQQRLDEVELRLAGLRALRTEHNHRADAIRQQIHAEIERLSKRQAFEISSPINGIIWRRLTKPGSEVVIGTEIAEIASCERAFLDVVVDEEKLSKIKVGQKAKAKFVGGDRYWTATVRSMRGAGAVTEDRLLAAKPQDRGPQESQVILDFDPIKLAASRHNFCLIGRSVELIFENNGAIFESLLTEIKRAYEKAQMQIQTIFQV